ncbi:hypothetical protein M1L60_27590 [Actinoplanes sp. TRM 88003]|uniref:Uncharacterized protein n=1 Tax=Paractinoplanes aksuensis TaxID=2939490 RepID=A0ABT1DU38_9ACTN|nr:hypothetical protein [Actinoplanes aksuensis]MCO8274368.1 hypothetical protein [Actinoplanes aksuensis]
MLDSSDSKEIAEPGEDGRTEDADSTVLAEVLPGVAVVFGPVPADLELDLIDFGLVPTVDRDRISSFLGAMGNAATVAGNLGNAFASVQGLYRISDQTRALLAAGGRLAVKDGANLGTVMANGRFIGQARLIPVTAVNAAGIAAAVGPALAMIAMQMQLSEIAGLARTNIALTGQVLRTIRHGQWAELTALVATIDQVVDQARAVGSVPTSLWDSVAGRRAALQTQLELYRLNVGDHIRQIQKLESRARRQYLETNAEAVLFDAYALLSSVKAWTGYQALHAARARAAGAEDAAEARLVEELAGRTGKELESALAVTTSLVDSLRRELRIIAELPGRATLPLPGKNKDSNAARQTAAGLLEALEPLADALHPAPSALAGPGVVCAPASADVEPSLRILRWFLRDDENLQVLGFSDEVDTSGSVSSIFSGAKEKLTGPSRTLVAVTDRRILTAKANGFLEQGEVRQEIPIEQVRYVRSATTPDKSGRLTVDVITRDENLQWFFPADVDHTQVDGLVGLLAASMTIPDAEREALQRRAALSVGPSVPAVP